MPEYNQLYHKAYFAKRIGNDPKRAATFRSEKEFIVEYINSGILLDVGCSTGEFLDTLKWDGPKYGMEISDYAAAIAKEKGILFDRDLFNSQRYFDIIIFRGTIQHIDTPFLYMKKAYDALKPGGYLIFLATPNTNSIYYKLWNTLPFLDAPINFYIPSDKTLINALKNFGFTLVKIRYPYFKSAYASPLKDHVNFVRKLFGMKIAFPFWGNSMDLIFKKPISKD